MDMQETAFGLLPEKIRKYCEKMPERCAGEIRLRAGSSARLLADNVEFDTHSPPVTSEDLNRILEKATCASLQTVSDELKNGFITYKGIRIGVCGRAAVKNGEIHAFSPYTSLNIRIPHPFRGELREEAEEICKQRGNTLIVSPPGIGKTTALRELIRLVSEAGFRVSVADDRGEIFPIGQSGEIYDKGKSTDVLSFADKENAALMMLRTMNPQFIAFDEISKREEIRAAREICGCGVNIMSTAHGQNAEEMKKRAVYRELFDEKIFTHILEIGMENGLRTYRLKKIC